MPVQYVVKRLMVRKSGSGYFYIPPWVLKMMEWRKGDYLVLEVDEEGKTILVRKAKLERTETGVKWK